MEVALLFPAPLCLIGGFFYFMMEPRYSSAIRALVISLYGPVIAVLALYLYVALPAGGPRTGESRDLMFLLYLVLPPILAVASVLLFRGPKWVHVFILPAGFCYLLMLVVGMFVYLNLDLRITM
jgi:hypothetical protein